MHTSLREGIGFEFNKDDGSIKMVEKKGPGQLTCCPSLISVTNCYKVYAAPLNSWRASSTTPTKCIVLKIHQN